MSASATVPSTGEIMSLPAETPEDIIGSLRVVSDYIKAWDSIKKELQKLALEIVDGKGRFEHDGYLLRTYTTQRMVYDRAVLREAFDDDLLDTFMEPQKSRIDQYLKEHLDELGDMSTKLRTSMVPTGKPYTVVRVERLERAA